MTSRSRGKSRDKIMGLMLVVYCGEDALAIAARYRTVI